MKSSSGKTLILNKGHLDGVKDREIGVLLKKIQFGDISKAVPVADIQAVKVVNNRSTWAVEKHHHPKLLSLGKHYHLLTYSESMRARRPLKIKRRKLIQHFGKEDEKVENLKSNENPELVKIKDVELEAKVYREATIMGHDYELIDLSEWRARKVNAKLSHRNIEKLYPTVIYRSPHGDTFEKELRLKTYNNMVANHLDKSNRSEFLEELKKKDKSLTPLNTYVKYQKEQEKEREKKQKFYKKLVGKDSRWSEGLSDRELAKNLSKMGAYSEDERIQKELLKLSRHQLKFGYGYDLNNNVLGGQSPSGANSKFLASWEYFLGHKYSLLSKLSTEVTVHRVNTTAIDEGRAVGIVEDSLEAGLNWYPFHFPDITQQFLYYFGFKIRYGRAQINTLDTNFKLRYAVSAKPVLQTGVKYMYNSGIGFQTQVQYARNVFRRIERKDPLEPLSGEIGVTDIRLSLALTMNI